MESDRTKRNQFGKAEKNVLLHGLIIRTGQRFAENSDLTACVAGSA